MNTSIALVRADGATARAHAEDRHAWWVYADEILGHQRTPFFRCDAGDLTAETTVALVATAEELTHAAAEQLHGWTEQGGTLLIVGAPGTVGERFGLEPVSTVSDGHVSFAPDEIWTQRPRSRCTLWGAWDTGSRPVRSRSPPGRTGPPQYPGGPSGRVCCGRWGRTCGRAWSASSRDSRSASMERRHRTARPRSTTTSSRRRTDWPCPSRWTGRCRRGSRP